MCECMRAEARVLNLGRNVVAYDLGGVRPQRARRKVDGARVSARRVAGGAIPDFSKTSLPAPRLPAVPSRESPLEPRPVGTVPEFAAHTHSTSEGSQSSGRRERVARRRRLRRGVCVYEAPMARPPPCIEGRARRGLLAFRGTGDLSPSPGLSSDGWKAAPERGRRATIAELQ